MAMKLLQKMRYLAAALLALSPLSALPAFAECYEGVPPRPVYKTFIHRDIVDHGVYDIARKPPRYGWQYVRTEEGYVPRRVLLRPYKNISYYQRPNIHRWRERAKIYPEGYVWRRVPPC